MELCIPLTKLNSTMQNIRIISNKYSILKYIFLSHELYFSLGSIIKNLILKKVN